MRASVLDNTEKSLDPEDWSAFRKLAHRALDQAIDYLESVRERPVWQPVPEDVRARLREGLPVEPQGIEQVYRDFRERVFPYATGNVHPRFFGWVHGTGTTTGVIAEMMAATMNSNCGGRDHGALYVERSVIEWCKQIFGYPATSSGLLVSGTSMATFIGLVVARNARAKGDIRADGISPTAKSQMVYASSEVHESVPKVLEILGLGHKSLHKIPVNADFSMNLGELKKAIAEDRRHRRQPFCVIGCAGTVNTGGLDDLEALSEIARAEGLWLHVDGAFGSLCALSPWLRKKVKGIELSDSIAFDFHKWLHVPYDAGCILVRKAGLQERAFSNRPAYLKGYDRGLGGGGEWFCDFGPELSRSFRALKVWFTIKTYGTKRLGEMIEKNCQQAKYLSSLIERAPELELLAPPTLNIVCFRFKAKRDAKDLDNLNAEIVADLQERGIAAPSTTRIHGKLAIRVNITNHRSRREDFDMLVQAVLDIGREPSPRSGSKS